MVSDQNARLPENKANYALLIEMNLFSTGKHRVQINLQLVKNQGQNRGSLSSATVK